MANKFRLPIEMHSDSKQRVPISARLEKSTRDFLKKAATKEGLSLSELVENILEDYSKFLKEKGYKE
jgi:uncharacterized protein (DUF1778 family)